MVARSVLTNSHGIWACVLLLWAGLAAAQQPIVHATPGDVPLCLAPAGGPSWQDQLWVG